MKFISTPILLAIGTLSTFAPLFAKNDPHLIEPSTWILQSWTKDGVQKDQSAHGISLVFDKTRLRGNSGVNSYSGPCTAHKGTLTLKGIGVTEIAGPPKLMVLEADYLALLGSMTTYKVDQTKLTLTDGTEKNQLRFLPAKKTAPKTLVETNWSLTTFETGKGPEGTAASLIDGTTITLTINKEGRVSGSGGVNRYFTSATIGKNGVLSFGRVGSTRRGGPAKQMRQEQTYFLNLAHTASYSIDQNTLTLSNKDESTKLIFRAK